MASYRAEHRRGRRRGGRTFAGRWVATTGRHRARKVHSASRLAVSALGLVTLSAAVITTAAAEHHNRPAPQSHAESAADVHADRPIRHVPAGGRYQRVSRNAERQALAAARQRRSDAREARQRQDARRQRQAREQRAARQRAARIAARQWVLPLRHYSLSARFGEVSYLWATSHSGLDLKALTGTPVRSIAAGVVTAAGYYGAYGNRVVVRLADGIHLWFGHLNTIDVEVGDRLTAGDQLGAVGYTGHTTGPHLHLEVRVRGGRPVDPFAVLVEHGLQP